jgi:type I restriction enzyme S subunit
LNSNWKTVSFSSVIELIGGGTPKTNVEEYWNGNIPWISIKDFNNDFRYVQNTEKTITYEGLKNSSTSILNKNDIIISARGTVGEIAMIPSSMAFNQSCYGIKAISDLSDSNFIYYALKHSLSVFKRNVHGSVFDTITKNTFNNIFLKLPPIEKQIEISNRLSMLDDKIEINKKINQNLEEISKVIFKEYFFNSEIFKEYTKSGHTPENYFIFSLKENCTFMKGKKPNTILERCDKGLKLYLTIDVLNSNSKLFASEENTVLADKDDILMVMDGASSGDIYFGKEGIIGSTLSKIVAKEEYKEIIFQIIKFFEKEIKKNNTGSAIPHVDKNFILDIKFLIPINISEINLIFKKIRHSIIGNNEENEILSNLRDLLLPKLMSGEIDVSNVKI